MNRLVMMAAAMSLCTAVIAQDNPSPPEEPSRVLAIVEDTEISSDDLWWFMEQTRGGDILDELILSRLLDAEAKQKQINIGEPDVDEALARLREQYATEEEFSRWLAESGQTLKGLRMQLQQELLIDRLLEERMGLTDEGIRRYYESHPHEFTEEPRVRLLDIVTDTIADAFAARERLAAGESFAEVAREMSQDPTAKEGGDRGWLTPEDVRNADLREVIFELQEGEVSDPIEAVDHFHVLYAREAVPGRLPDLEEVRPQVIERIRERRGISEELFLALLKRRAEIEVRWPEHQHLNDYYADLSRIKVVVDDRRVEVPVEPRLLPNSNLIVPAQPLLEAMGADVAWSEEAGVLEVRRDGVTLRMVQGLDIMATGEEERRMPEPARREDGVLMISPRAPVSALGGELFWNRADNTLYVNSYIDDTVGEMNELP